MTRQACFFFALLVALIVGGVAQAVLPRIQILSIKAFLYYHGTGSWSKDVTSRNFKIKNAVKGGGSLKHPAEKTLFVIEAEAPRAIKGEKTVQVKISFRKGSTGALIYNRPHKVGMLKAAQKVHIPVLVDTRRVGWYTVRAYFTDGLSGKPLGETKEISVEYAGK